MSHDPDTTTDLAALYLAGALTDGERATTERRLRDGDAPLRRALDELGPAADALAAAAPPAAPPPGIRERLIERVSGGRSSGPEAQVWRDWSGDEDSDLLFTLRRDEGGWEETGVDGVQVRRLFVDRAANRMTAMFRMAPGTAYPSHVHEGAEECYVLEGDLHVGDIVLGAGDYQRATSGSEHGVQRTEGGCLLLVNSSLADDMV